MSDDWTPVFSAATTWTELQAIIEDYAQRSIDDVCAYSSRSMPTCRRRSVKSYSPGYYHSPVRGRVRLRGLAGGVCNSTRQLSAATRYTEPY